MKTCPKCGETKPLDDFYRRGNGYRHNCRACICARQRSWLKRKTQDPMFVMSRRKKDRDRHRGRYQEDPAYREKKRSRRTTKCRSPRLGAVYRHVRDAIETGRLVPADCCERCGHDFSEHKRESHHADYSKPLEVEWLCQPCHAHEHRKKDDGVIVRVGGE